MSYCPECGSEVAQNDVFCAYCGIALPNVVQQSELSETASEPIQTSDLTQETSATEIVEENTAAPTLESISENIEENSIPSVPVILQEAEENEENNQIVNEPPADNSFLDESNYEDKSEEVNSEIEQTKPQLEVTEEESFRNDNEFVLPQTSESSDESSLNIIEPTVAESNQTSEEKEEIPEDVYSEINVPTAPQNEPQLNSDQSIENNFQPVSENNSSELEMPEVKNDLDEEERLRSVLDEIDLNFQNQNEQSQNEEKIEKGNEPFQEEGVVIPTAANLQQEFVPNLKEDEIIQPSASNYAPLIPSEFGNNLETPPLVEKEFEFENSVLSETEATEFDRPTFGETESKEIVQPSEPIPVAEANLINEMPTLLSHEFNKAELPINKESNPLEVKSEEKESRSYTNPNIGNGDTDNRNKTKLKPLDEGTVLNGRYEIVRKIGGGGMGAVYLATDKNLGGVLRAVKEMVQSYIEDEQQEKAVNDFKRESLLLTSMEHSAIPTIYDYFFDDKEARFYLVMKYISGGDLAARLRSAPEGRLDEVSVTDWAIQLTDVLDYLHNRQPPIVYRDLKPSNIMIDGNNGKLMLIDFGIARWVNSKEEKGVTAVGTMGYAPPELFSGNVEPRSDIYSLGSTMFHLLTGADPQSNPLLIFDFNKNPKPRQINSGLSDQMEQILMRAVEYNSSQRFTDAAEMKNALIQHMENLKRGNVTFGVVNTSAGSHINANVPVFCGFCGQKIVATDMFCPFCGAQQPLAAQSKKLVQQPAYASPKLFPRLVIFGTNSLESMDFVLEKDSNLLGRRDPMSNIFPEVDLSKFDPQTKISRKHARIWREGDVYMLEDLGSSNGTTLISAMNGSIRLLPRQPQVLSHGDKVKLGDTTLRFTVG